MDFLGQHRYLTAAIISGLLFIVGSVVVMNRAAISPSGTSGGITINGVIQGTDSALPLPGTPQPVRPAAVDVPYTNVTKNDVPATNTPVDEGYDWLGFLTSITKTKSAPTSGTSDTGIKDAYSFVPTGLLSIDKPQSVYEMTASQKLLYGWGNDAGGAILSYENNHPDQAAVLTNYMQDRQNPAKIQAIKGLGADLQAIGNAIDGLGDPPPQLSSYGPALADQYREIGRKLAIIPDTQGDDALVDAILIYNTSAEVFVKKFVSVALIFQANDVKFSQDEGGSVFMFPAN